VNQDIPQHTMLCIRYGPMEAIITLKSWPRFVVSSLQRFNRAFSHYISHGLYVFRLRFFHKFLDHCIVTYYKYDGLSFSWLLGAEIWKYHAVSPHGWFLCGWRRILGVGAGLLQVEGEV